MLDRDKDEIDSQPTDAYRIDVIYTAKPWKHWGVELSDLVCDLKDELKRGEVPKWRIVLEVAEAAWFRVWYYVVGLTRQAWAGVMGKPDRPCLALPWPGEYQFGPGFVLAEFLRLPKGERDAIERAAYVAAGNRFDPDGNAIPARDLGEQNGGASAAGPFVYAATDGHRVL